MMNLFRLRERGPVTIASEYLRLHDQEIEPGNGLWP